MSVDAYSFVWKLSKSQVTPFEKLLLLSIADRCGESGECWPSLARLEKDTGICRRALINLRNKVIKKGILRFTGEYRGRRKQIPVMQLMVNEWREGTINTDDENDQCIPCTGEKSNEVYQCTGCTSDQCISCTLNLKDKEPKRKIYSAKTFEDFWELYPKKKAKDSCKTKWKTKKLDKIGEEIIAKLKEQIEHDDEWRHGYIPNPLTYINQSRWKDDLTPPKPKPQAIQAEPKNPTAKEDTTLFASFLGGIATDIRLGLIDKAEIPKISIVEWKTKNYGEDHRSYLKSLNIEVRKVPIRP